MGSLAMGLAECKLQLRSSPKISDRDKSIINSSFGDCEELAQLAFKTFGDAQLPSEVYHTESESETGQANESEDEEGYRDSPSNHLGQVLRPSKAYESFRKVIFERTFPNLDARFEERYIRRPMTLTARFGSRQYLLSQIDVHTFDDDAFFQALRSDYYRLRGRMRNWFSVWRYSHCDFYQINKFDDAAYAPKLKDDYPQTRDEYDYNPDPMDIIPPITEHEFYCRFYSCFKFNGLSIHLLHSCRKASGNSCDALNLLPKKKVRLEEYGDKRQMFWGIYAQEIICFRWIVAYNILCLLPMVVFLFLWIFPLGYKGDLQNAAVPLTAMVGLLTLFWSFFVGSIKFGSV
ncbi:uncharacterized protein BDV14DRAFT_201635 [Aspergillus stella-maris]|uniref:uncharacterized protein n=1 Tax=Aspergillus stella-maris TaxID=1810926 RepID=UPI003CCCB020